MFVASRRLTRILLILSPLVVAGCATTGDVNAAKTEAASALATANQSRSEAQQALTTAQQALKTAQQAQSASKTAMAQSNRMYQRQLEK